jgi:hypothetical protein
MRMFADVANQAAFLHPILLILSDTINEFHQDDRALLGIHLTREQRGVAIGVEFRLERLTGSSMVPAASLFLWHRPTGETWFLQTR